MAINAYFTTNLRGSTAAYGHAMPCNLKGILCGIRPHTLAPITFEAQGITVPISRGSPPVLTE